MSKKINHMGQSSAGLLKYLVYLLYHSAVMLKNISYMGRSVEVLLRYLVVLLDSGAVLLKLFFVTTQLGYSDNRLKL